MRQLLLLALLFMGPLVCIADRRPDDLVDEIGKVQRTFPRAIASRSTDGKRNSVWRGISPANSVQVDEASLTALRRTLVSEALAQRGDPEAQGAVERLIVIKGQLQEVDVLLKLSRNTVAPGYVPLRYAEAKTGRLFGLGPSLQNASRCVRNAALAGCCDYDISNCHWAFVYARAVAAGCPCPVIEEYLSNKASVRGAIASAANISVDQAKECLLMTIFGAPRTVRKQDAIPSTIGVEAARRLYKVPAFQELHGEIGKARKAILQAWKPSGGGFVNAVGLRILASKSAPKRFAHLLQGMEALALMEVVRDQGENVQVCVHDGWVTRHQVSRSHMESIIKRALGCPVQLEERRLDPVLFDHAAHSDVDLAALDAWPADDLVQTANGQQSEQSCGVAADFDHFCASKDEQEEYVDPWAPEAGSPIQPSIILTLRPGWNCNNDKMIGPRARRK